MSEPVRISGPESAKLVEEEQAWLAPGIQRLATLAGIAMRSGQGVVLEDEDGRSYLDFMAGVCVASLGHSHPRWASAISRQASQLAVGSFTSQARVALLKLLASILPEPLRRVQLYSGGAEAVESAIRLAKARTGKFEVVSFWGGFHGKTGGVLSLIGDPFKRGWGPLTPGAHLVPYADCYRCPLKTAYPGCGLGCVDLAREQLRAASLGAVAAVIVEPIQGTAGNVVPPADWLPAVRDLTKELGALLIVDEMITGFGRTGTMFGFEHTDTLPDVMTIGKGFGAGFPVTGVVTTAEIAQAEPWSKPSSSSSSYGGNPLASAAALATVETILEEGLVENSQRVGELMLERLREMQERFRVIGDVRGKGLLIGLDLVADRATREPLPARLTERLYGRCVELGLLVMAYGARVRINPPLVIGEEEALAGLDIFETALEEIEADCA
ncbi:MAG: aspartate aminotransferase family protein [Deltaproteobacteria bacterium]|nr:aspartate aminotransferase family protein [Deltaproteobacteria bacterium]